MLNIDALNDELNAKIDVEKAKHTPIVELSDEKFLVAAHDGNEWYLAIADIDDIRIGLIWGTPIEQATPSQQCEIRDKLDEYFQKIDDQYC